MKKQLFVVLAAALVLTLAGCTTKKTKMQNKEMGATSDARVTLTKKYTDCVSQAGSDKAAVEACDAILESKEKLK